MNLILDHTLGVTLPAFALKQPLKLVLIQLSNKPLNIPQSKKQDNKKIQINVAYIRKNIVHSNHIFAITM